MCVVDSQRGYFQQAAAFDGANQPPKAGKSTKENI